MTPGNRRNGRRKFGPFKRVSSGPRAEAGQEAPGRPDLPSPGRHASPRGKAARKRANKAVPAAAAAATLAAGTAAYLLLGGHAPQAAQLSDAMSAGTRQEGAGPVAIPRATVDGSTGGGSVLVKVAMAHPAPAIPAAKVTVTATPAVTSPATSSGTPSAVSATATAAAGPAAPPSSAAATSRSSSSSALSCDPSGGLLPANVTAIVSFLLANGYSDNAAAGIAGNIYQESKGDPESEGMGGGGLIGWTPLPPGFVTGDVSADLETQLNALLTYNQGWSQYRSALNAASSPASAAYIYVTDFERAGIPAAATREAAATDVAKACGI